MKTETLHTLITARTLLDRARDMCLAEDKHLASAGLIVLQDGLELVLFACLIELDIDEQKSLEKLTFDELIAELRKQGKRVTKSGTLKALNRERVNVKHYGQLAEPGTVRAYFNAAIASSEVLLQEVVGLGLQQIMLHELIKPCESKEHIRKACAAIELRNYFEALTEIRKAIFLEVEKDYSIEGFTTDPGDHELGLFDLMLRGGEKAPWHTKNAKWIEENVNTPFDYIQIDRARLRSDLMEWGVQPEDFWNVRRLTPPAMKINGEWVILVEPVYISQPAANEQNVGYCLDRAVSIVLKKQTHSARFRGLKDRHQFSFSVISKIRQQLYAKASLEASERGTLEEGKSYPATAYVPGLDGKTLFVEIHDLDANRYLHGYVLAKNCEEGEMSGLSGA